MSSSRTGAARPAQSTCSRSTDRTRREAAAAAAASLPKSNYEMTSMTDREIYLARAAQARADADAATLDNVRDRCLRSEAAWTEMAARAERTEKMRQTLLADKERAAAEAAAES